MTHSYKRSDRVSDQILKELSYMIAKGEIKDPRVDYISITSIKLSDDLSHARIYFTPMMDITDKNEILEGLNSAKGFIKTRLSKKLRLKKFPEIEFEYDDFIEKSQRLDRKIRNSDDG